MRLQGNKTSPTRKRDGIKLDVTNLEQINNAVAQAIALHAIDVVFNNAGYGLMGALEAISDKQILRG